MAHELTISKMGAAEMFYVGETPWHRLGQAFPEGITSEQVLDAVPLRWTADLHTLYVHLPTGPDGGLQAHPVETHRSVVRSDTGTQLGVVGKGFTPFQNVDLLAFTDALLSESGAK